MSARTNPTSTGTPLRQNLLIRVGTLVTGAVLLVGMVFFQFGVEPLVRRIAEARFAEAAIRVEASLDNIFQPAQYVLKMSHHWIGEAPLSPEGAAPFNRLFMPILAELPHATSIVAGTSAGQGWMLMQRPEGGWRNRLTDVQRWGNTHLFLEHEADGRVKEDRRVVDYDPRQRSWYTISATEPHRVHWTAPYRFFTTGDPGITASISFPLSDGRLFAVGIDLMLRDLSATTMEAHPGNNGLALVLTEDQRVLALPAPPAAMTKADWLGKILKPVGELGIAEIASAMKQRPSHDQPEIRTFSSNGTTWLARVHPYALGKQDLWVVTLAPAADFAPDWLPILLPMGAALAMLLLLVALFASQQARKIAQPLESLATASEKFGQLDFEHRAIPETGIAEIGKLAAAQERMRNLLRRHQQQISS